MSARSRRPAVFNRRDESPPAVLNATLDHRVSAPIEWLDFNRRTLPFYDYAFAMSRGHGRVQRIILQSVSGTRYGCTISQLAYLSYGIDRKDGPTEAQIAAVRRAVSRLLHEERVIERVMLGTDTSFPPSLLCRGRSSDGRRPAPASRTSRRCSASTATFDG